MRRSVPTAERALQIAAGLGALGIALGAFGAHALQERLAGLGTTAIWEKAVFYHLLHTVMLAVLASREVFRPRAWWAFCLGILFFSGSLYVLAFTGIRWLGAITPVGGIAFIAGWLMLLWPAPPSGPAK